MTMYVLRKSFVFTFQIKSIMTFKMTSLLLDLIFRCLKWCFYVNWLFIITFKYLHWKEETKSCSKRRNVIFDLKNETSLRKWMSSYLLETNNDSWISTQRS
jgi:hypothetical protein